MVTVGGYASPAFGQSYCIERSRMVLVYVLNKLKQPLMPTTPVKARILLKQGSAKVIRKLPFTIRLQYETSSYVAPLTHGVDTGSKILGSAVTDDAGNILYMSEVEVRNDIAGKLKSRRESRRNRRSRKTRYRQARWRNRKNSTKSGRFSPTMVSKVNAHLKEIRFVRSILPIAKTVLETGSFDPHALKNPEVLNNPLLYQQGANYGFANTKAYVLWRDGYKCHHCKGKSGDSRLHVHHIVFRTNGGSDNERNLITLCKTCHDELHAGVWELKLRGKRKEKLKHATQMNSIRVQLLRLLPEATETFGFITKENRQRYTAVKEHHVDAVFIAWQALGVRPVLKTNVVLQRRCVASGDYQRRKGTRSETPIPAGKIMGFLKFDKVRYRGNDYFIKGRFSTGYAILMGLDGQKVDLKPIPKFNRMKRIEARKPWLTSHKTTASI